MVGHFRLEIKWLVGYIAVYKGKNKLNNVIPLYGMSLDRVSAKFFMLFCCLEHAESLVFKTPLHLLIYKHKYLDDPCNLLTRLKLYLHVMWYEGYEKSPNHKFSVCKSKHKTCHEKQK